MNEKQIISKIVDELKFKIKIEGDMLYAFMHPIYEYNILEMSMEPVRRLFGYHRDLRQTCLVKSSAYDVKQVSEYEANLIANEMLYDIKKEIANRIEKELNDYANRGTP